MVATFVRCLRRDDQLLTLGATRMNDALFVRSALVIAVAALSGAGGASLATADATLQRFLDAVSAGPACSHVGRIAAAPSAISNGPLLFALGSGSVATLELAPGESVVRVVGLRRRVGVSVRAMPLRCV